MKHSIILIISLVLVGCCKEDCIKHYIFEVPLAVSPAHSSLNVGDTLHVRMVTSNQAIHDIEGNRIVQFPEFDPNAIFQLPIIDSLPIKEGLVQNEILIDSSIFETQILDTEHLGLGLFFLDIPKDETESIIEFKVVFNTPGQYMLICRDALPFTDMSNELKFPDRCGHDGVLQVSYKISQGDHAEILSNIHQDVLDVFWEKSAGDKSISDTYYFKVE